MDLSAIPTTVFVMLGAVLAAMLTGAFSFVNMVLSKEVKTSEARLAWNDGLRSDLSTMLANVETLTRLAEHELREKELDEFSDQQLWIFRGEHKEQFLAANEARHRILLRVNPEKHGALIAAIAALFTAFRAFRGPCSAAKAIYDDAQNLVAVEAQKVLRGTWKKVKQGEPAFALTKRAVKWVSSALVVGFVVLLAVGMLSIAKQRAASRVAASSPAGAASTASPAVSKPASAAPQSK